MMMMMYHAPCLWNVGAQKELWRGLCGRCGRLGDHWSDTCPGKWGSSADSSPLTKRIVHPYMIAMLVIIFIIVIVIVMMMM
eukprot:1902208-Karenia_brevis.AAC.1